MHSHRPSRRNRKQPTQDPWGKYFSRSTSTAKILSNQQLQHFQTQELATHVLWLVYGPLLVASFGRGSFHWQLQWRRSANYTFQSPPWRWLLHLARPGAEWGRSSRLIGHRPSAIGNRCAHEKMMQAFSLEIEWRDSECPLAQQPCPACIAVCSHLPIARLFPADLCLLCVIEVECKDQS